jgi:hypothetical protein
MIYALLVLQHHQRVFQPCVQVNILNWRLVKIGVSLERLDDFGNTTGPLADFVEDVKMVKPVPARSGRPEPVWVKFVPIRPVRQHWPIVTRAGANSQVSSTPLSSAIAPICLSHYGSGRPRRSFGLASV